MSKLLFSNSILATALSVALSITSVTTHANNLPDLGTAAVNSLSLEKENVLGDAYMRVIRSSAPMLEDPVLNQYITELGNRLVAHATGVKTPFSFFLLRNDEINAFAFFGGHVGIHTGLFLNADNESELASVLAHEIAHVTQRHLARSIEAGSKTSTASAVGILGSILLTIAAPQVGIAALMTTQALSTQSKINYTRQNEKEADRIGMKTLVDAGFDPNGAADFFSKLAARYRFTTQLPQMLLTHPLPESRITEARNRAAQYSHRHIPDQLNFQLAKARIQVRFSHYDNDAALALFQKQLKLKRYTFKSAALYGEALALFELKQFSASQKIIDGLLAKDPNNLFYIDTKTDLLLAQDNNDMAIAMLLKQQQLKPTSTVINTNLANVYIESNQVNQAIPLLEDLIFYNNQDQLAYILLTKAYKKAGNQAMAHFVKAETLALNADYKTAIDQLNFAYQKTTNNPLQQARIEAKIRQFRYAETALEQLR